MSERANEGAQRSEQTKERSGARDRSKQGKCVSGASEQTNGRASGPVLTSGFSVDLARSVSAHLLYHLGKEKEEDRKNSVFSIEK